MSGTVWNSYSSFTLADADQVDENFDWLEGDLVPQNAGSLTDAVYDLGTSANSWRTAHLKTSLIIGGTTLSGPADDSTLEFNSGNLRIKQLGVAGSTANSGGSARQIAQGTVSTPDIRDNAVTMDQSSNNNPLGSGPSLIATVSITTFGFPVIVMLNAAADINTFAGTVADAVAVVTRDGTNIDGNSNRARIGATLISTSTYLPVSFAFIDIPSAGGHTYKATIHVSSGTGGAPTPNLLCMELKK